MRPLRFILPPWKPDVMIALGMVQVVLWTAQIPLVLYFRTDLARSLPYVVCISIAANILGALSWVQSAVTEKRQLELQAEVRQSNK